MTKILKMLLKVGVPFLAVFGFMNCSPTAFEAYHTSVNRAGFFNKKGPSFMEIMSEYGSTAPTTPPSQVDFEQHKIVVDADAVPQCAVGEWDILNAAIACTLPSYLLVTIMDQTGEQVALRFPLNGTSDINVLSTQLLPAIQSNVVGKNAHVFLCIDANNNSKCSDEAIVDLNTISGQVLAAGGGGATQANLNRVGTCDILKRGLVFFHKLHNFTAADQTSNITVTTADMAADVAQDILHNLDSATSTTTTSNGPVVTFPIRLARADANTCPKPNIRTNGCFVKGTQINISEELAVPIESLHVGQPVYMADGRTLRIKRIVAGPEAKPVITFEMGAGAKITVTTEHPLVTNKGLRLAKDIRIGEVLVDVKGNAVTILGIQHSSYQDLVYNFEFDGTRENDHLIIAENIVSGDLYLQNKLANEAHTPTGLNLLSAK